MKKYPFPIRLLFGFIVIYSWGVDIRLPLYILTYCHKPVNHCYLSPDGTPNQAVFWLWGKP
jgi:hypothetical protein